MIARRIPIMKNTWPGEKAETVELAIKMTKEAKVISFGPETKVEKNNARISWANQIVDTS